MSADPCDQQRGHFGKEEGCAMAPSVFAATNVDHRDHHPSVVEGRAVIASFAIMNLDHRPPARCAFLIYMREVYT
eukprot:10005960-Karenia_brevis.AAC.1